jgi:peptide deformylase
VDSVTPELKTLAENMLETMHEFRGIGLAATQVGQEVRLLVMDTRPKENGRYKTEDFTELELAVKQPVIIFNPEIIAKQGETTFDEGCLSVPGYFETVSRYDYVEVQGLDENGETIVIKTDGLISICLQHEMDHLEGKLFIDRLSIIRANRLKNKIKKNGYPKPEELMNHEEESL